MRGNSYVSSTPTALSKSNYQTWPDFCKEARSNGIALDDSEIEDSLHLLEGSGLFAGGRMPSNMVNVVPTEQGILSLRRYDRRFLAAGSAFIATFAFGMAGASGLAVSVLAG